MFDCVWQLSGFTFCRVSGEFRIEVFGFGFICISGFAIVLCSGAVECVKEMVSGIRFLEGMYAKNVVWFIESIKQPNSCKHVTRHMFYVVIIEFVAINVQPFHWLSHHSAQLFTPNNNKIINYLEIFYGTLLLLRREQWVLSKSFLSIFYWNAVVRNGLRVTFFLCHVNMAPYSYSKHYSTTVERI